MNKYDNLADIIRNDIVECNLILKEENPRELFTLIDKMLKIFKDKNKLANISNFEMFSLFINCSNSDTYSYYETVERLNEIKKTVNNWTFDNTKDIFAKIVNNKSEEEQIKNIGLLTDIGITPELCSYNLKGTLLVMNRFMEYKKRVAEISKFNPLLIQPTLNLNAAQKAQMIEKIYASTDMEAIMTVIKKYKDSNEEALRIRKQNAQRRLEIEELILYKINDGSIEKMTVQIPEEWCKYLNLDVANELLFIILDNLIIEYETEKEINKVTNNIMNKTPLIKCLYDNNINPSLIDKNILEQLEQYSESINNIEFLISLGIDPVKNTTLILSIKKEQRETINMLIKSNVLTTKTLIKKSNNYLETYNWIINTYNILKNNNFDFNNKFYDDKVLLSNPKDLINTISIVKAYNFINNDYYVYLICNPNMIRIYDIIMENSLPVEFIFLAGKTKNPLNTIKRMLIYKQLDIPIIDKERNLKKDLYDERRAIVYDQDINDYLSNAVDERIYIEINGKKINDEQELIFIKELDKKYLYRKDAYKMGNTIISRPKVLKNLNEAIKERLDIRKCILPILISSSIYSEKEIFDIEKELKTKKLSIG